MRKKARILIHIGQISGAGSKYNVFGTTILPSP